MVASPKGLGSEKECASKGQQHIPKTDSSSRQRGRPTKTRLYLSNSNKYLITSPRWWLDTETYWLTDWLTVSRNVTLTLEATKLTPSAWGYNWASLFLGDINAGTWPSRLEESRIWDSKILSWVPRESDPRMTALVRASSNCKRQTRHLVREGALQKQDSNC
jgi:hypothetical protein